MTSDDTTTEATEASAESAEEDDRFLIGVRAADGSEVTFRIRPTTQVQRVMSAYCLKIGQPTDAIRFLYDGDRIKGEQSAEELGLAPGDTIDAVIHQTGS
ncbi:ubiquitin-like protein [Streptomyces sp. NPDC051563]|uniref:ubiquitin-like protein n=1 Tax=Streptomyces sp. NPDC051563 TaxID=3365659 RepID=UPI003792450A